jgi:hypothetical protein
MDKQYEAPAVTKLGSLQDLTLKPPVKTKAGVDHFGFNPSEAVP